MDDLSMTQQFNNRFLTPRSDFGGFVEEVAKAACLNEEVFPIGSARIIRGVRCIRTEDGGVAFGYAVTGKVDPVTDHSRMTVTLDNLWETSPQGENAESTELRCSVSTGINGMQRCRMWLREGQLTSEELAARGVEQHDETGIDYFNSGQHFDTDGGPPDNDN